MVDAQKFLFRLSLIFDTIKSSVQESSVSETFSFFWYHWVQDFFHLPGEAQHTLAKRFKRISQKIDQE
jgi:hypothetical protein